MSDQVLANIKADQARDPSFAGKKISHKELRTVFKRESRRRKRIEAVKLRSSSSSHSELEETAQSRVNKFEEELSYEKSKALWLQNEKEYSVKHDAKRAAMKEEALKRARDILINKKINC